MRSSKDDKTTKKQGSPITSCSVLFTFCSYELIPKLQICKVYHIIYINICTCIYISHVMTKNGMKLKRILNWRMIDENKNKGQFHGQSGIYFTCYNEKWVERGAIKA